MKLCILTGGSRGLGAELQSVLEARGWTVHEISRSGSSPTSFRFDLANTGRLDEVQAWMSGLVQGVPPERAVFVHNAGQVEPIARMGSVPRREAIEALQAGVVAPYVLIAGFVELLRDAPIPKAVVNISSGAASKGYAGWSLYCAQKAALENALRALFEEEKSEARPYRVVSVNPHVMDTAMQARIRAADPAHFPQKDRFVKLKAEGQLLSPVDVARAVADVVEDDSAMEFLVSVKERLG